MTGGMICPPVEAEASTAPAKAGLKPDFLITGMVIVPVETTFDMAAPDSVPNKAELATAAWAAPPVNPPVSLLAIFIRSSPAPEAISTEPKTMNIRTFPETTCKGWPNIPPVWDQKLRTMDRRLCSTVELEPANIPVHSGRYPRTKKYNIQNTQNTTMNVPKYL